MAAILCHSPTRINLREEGKFQKAVSALLFSGSFYFILSVSLVLPCLSLVKNH